MPVLLSDAARGRFTQELLIVNREQWILQPYQRRAGRLSKTMQSHLPESGVLTAG
jgi:hypothetical protein